MTPDDFARVEALFAAAIALPPEERALALDQACGEAPHLRADVDSLLEAHARLRAEPLLEARRAPAEPACRSMPRPGAIVGAYRLIDKIGEGGMGEVHLAVRADGAFDRQVAIKLMRPAFVDGDALRRFERERQILASLDHPHIVRLLDGGVTPEGLAYFVMEHVAGVPITDYCAARNPGLAERLRLFRLVCGAVQHAHRHAVVHRDLKPANLLITAAGVPKVLDFGVARLVAEHLDDERTIGVLPAPLTPNYASPEQLRGLAVTTASDVYALGVLLYEIVAGVRPYDTRGVTLDRVLALVASTDPMRPSAAIGSRVLGTPPYGRRQVKGDVDAIVMKALAKDPAERYASAQELDADLDRVARRRPVEARPPSAPYVARRFAARHRALVSIAAAATVAILAALGTALWQWQEARAQQQRAERRFAELRQLANKVLFDYQTTLRLVRGATDLRARMAADSLAFLDGLAAERSDNESLLLDVARGYLAIAEVQGTTRASSVGDATGARRSLERADQVLGELDARQPGMAAVAALRAERACVAARNEPARAVANATECLERLTPLVSGRPPDDPLVLRLGDAHLMLAEAGMLAHAPAAVSVFEPLADHPEIGRRSRLTLALLHRLIGWDRLEQGDPQGAIRSGEAALAALEPLLGDSRESLPMEQSFTLQLLGQGRLAAGEIATGRAALEEAVQQSTRAVAVNPGDAFIQDRVALAYADTALLLEPVDRAAAARLYRDGAALLPSLRLPFQSPHRDRVRGQLLAGVGSSRVDLQACKLEYSIVSPK